MKTYSYVRCFIFVVHLLKFVIKSFDDLWKYIRYVMVKFSGWLFHLSYLTTQPDQNSMEFMNFFRSQIQLW